MAGGQPAPVRRPHALAPGELAEAAILGDLAALCVLAGRFTPVAGAFQLAATAPLAALVARHRLRVGGTGIVVAMAVVASLGGTGSVISVGIAGLFALAVGIGVRRRWARWRVVVFACATAWPVIAALTLGALTVFDDLRETTFEQVEVQWSGMERVLRSAGMDDLADRGEDTVATALASWRVVVPAFQLGLTVLVASGSLTIAGPVVRRVRASLGDARRATAEDETRPVAPLPVTVPPLGTLEDTPGLVAVVGDNGVGKSTLLRALAGWDGPLVAERPAGRAGLGVVGGTAFLAQRPDTQVVAPTVLGEVAGPDGVADTAHLAVAHAALDRVGLSGLAERDPGSLSGGQQQRLALARLLVTRPRLVLSDETTAMLDPDGRALAMAVFAELVAGGATVVHATHLRAEVEAADVVWHLERRDAGAVSSEGPR